MDNTEIAGGAAEEGNGPVEFPFAVMFVDGQDVKGVKWWIVRKAVGFDDALHQGLRDDMLMAVLHVMHDLRWPETDLTCLTDQGEERPMENDTRIQQLIPKVQHCRG